MLTRPNNANRASNPGQLSPLVYLVLQLFLCPLLNLFGRYIQTLVDLINGFLPKLLLSSVYILAYVLLGQVALGNMLKGFFFQDLEH